jgi:hypothetical protein
MAIKPTLNAVIRFIARASPRLHLDACAFFEDPSMIRIRSVFQKVALQYTTEPSIVVDLSQERRASISYNDSDFIKGVNP